MTRARDTDDPTAAAPRAPQAPTGRVQLYAVPGVPLEALHLAVEHAEAEGLASVPVQAWITLGNRDHLRVPLDLVEVLTDAGGALLALQDAGWTEPFRE